MMHVLRPAALLGAVALVGCAGASTPDAAQAALNAGDPAEARTLCERALARDDLDGPQRSRFESIAMKAAASLGDGEDVLTRLDHAWSEEPARVDAAFHMLLANLLADEGEYAGAGAVTKAGVERFPEVAAQFDARGEDFAQLAVAAATAAAEGGEDSGASAQVEKLKALGYLGN